MNQKIIQFCPYCGKRTIEALLFGKTRPHCSACGWSHFEDPKVSATVLVHENRKVLLVSRIFNPFRGQWTLPGGFVDAHEDPESAAERECLEETGLQVIVSKLVDVSTGREHPDGADIVLTYLATVTGGNLHAGDDAMQVSYFRCDQLPPLAFKTTQKVLENCMDML